MKSLKERFEEDYMAVSVPVDNRNGFTIRYIYSGPWFYWMLPEKTLFRKKVSFPLISIANLFLYFLTGTRFCSCNSQMAVVTPGILGLCMNILEISACVQFLCAGYRTSRLTFRNVDCILSIAPLLHGIAGSLSCLVCGWYLICGAADVQNLFAGAGYMICGLMAFYLAREYKGIPFDTQKNHEIEKYSSIYNGRI